MMGGHDEELARLLEPLFAEVAEHHRRLVGAGVNPEAVASALAGWGAKGMAEYQGPGTAARLLRTLAEAIEEGEELTPGGEKSGGADSNPRPPPIRVTRWRAPSRRRPAASRGPVSAPRR